MMSFEEKKLGKNQKHILLFAYWNELVLLDYHQLLNQSCKSLIQRGLIEIKNNIVTLTPLGNRIVETELLNTADLSISSVDELLTSIGGKSNNKSKVKKLGKKQNILLNFIAKNSLEIANEITQNHVILSLKQSNLIEFSGNQIKITEDGQATLSDPINELKVPIDSQISKALNLVGIKPTKINKKETMFLQFLFYESPRPLKHILKAKQIIPSLEGKGLLEIVDDEIQITPDGKSVLENTIQNSKFNFSINELTENFLATNKIELEEEYVQKSNQILELYKQGLTYQAIGDLQKPKLTRERIRQILAKNPAWEETLQEIEETKLREEKEAEEKKEEFTKQKLLSGNLVAMYPERVAILNLKKFWLVIHFNKSGSNVLKMDIHGRKRSER